MKKQLLNIALLLATASAVKAQVSFAPAVNYGVGTNPRSIFSADFNGDGKMDLVTTNQGGNNVSVLLGSSTGTFASAANYAVGINPEHVFSADFNADGNMDLAYFWFCC
ncbi:MAG: VCBS repeat-containing protein [Bacteroidetes bacterium]|nr:VCBS repeat-containing protein [Bacteroidota bacterium]